MQNMPFYLKVVINTGTGFSPLGCKNTKRGRPNDAFDGVFLRYHRNYYKKILAKYPHSIFIISKCLRVTIFR